MALSTSNWTNISDTDYFFFSLKRSWRGCRIIRIRWSLRVSRFPSASPASEFKDTRCLRDDRAMDRARTSRAWKSAQEWVSSMETGGMFVQGGGNGINTLSKYTSSADTNISGNRATLRVALRWRCVDGVGYGRASSGGMTLIGSGWDRVVMFVMMTMVVMVLVVMLRPIGVATAHRRLVAPTRVHRHSRQSRAHTLQPQN